MRGLAKKFDSPMFGELLLDYQHQFVAMLGKCINYTLPVRPIRQAFDLDRRIEVYSQPELSSDRAARCRPVGVAGEPAHFRASSP
jgi:hypothetical protein